MGSTESAVVELRGVEPLSEGSQTGPSPSAVCGSDFPAAHVHRQTCAPGSFMLRTHGKAYMRSFPALMTLVTGHAGRPGQRHGQLGRESKIAIVSYFFSPF